MCCLPADGALPRQACHGRLSCRAHVGRLSCGCLQAPASLWQAALPGDRGRLCRRHEPPSARQEASGATMVQGSLCSAVQHLHGAPGSPYYAAVGPTCPSTTPMRMCEAPAGADDIGSVQAGPSLRASARACSRQQAAQPVLCRAPCWSTTSAHCAKLADFSLSKSLPSGASTPLSSWTTPSS